MLTNGESWYSLSKTNIDNLENVDKNLTRKILNTGCNTPIPMLYLELGCLRIGTILYDATNVDLTLFLSGRHEYYYHILLYAVT